MDCVADQCTCRHGKQGILNTASKQQLENEFGTSNEDEIVKKILTSGDVQSSEVCVQQLWSASYWSRPVTSLSCQPTTLPHVVEMETGLTSSAEPRAF